MGLVICVLSFASAIAKVWRWTIDKNPPDLMQLRINEVRVNLPDSNADGVSHRGEVFPISAFEIYRIDAMPKAVAENERVDAAGNVIPYWSWVKTRSTDAPPKLKMADIFFRVIE